MSGSGLRYERVRLALLSGSERVRLALLHYLIDVRTSRMGAGGNPHPRPLKPDSRPFAVAFLRIAREAHLIPLRLCVSAPLC